MPSLIIFILKKFSKTFQTPENKKEKKFILNISGLEGIVKDLVSQKQSYWGFDQYAENIEPNMFLKFTPCKYQVPIRFNFSCLVILGLT